MILSQTWNRELKKEKRGNIIPFKSKVNHDCVRVLWDGSRTPSLFHKSYIDLIEDVHPVVIPETKKEIVKEPPYVFYTHYEVR